MIDHETKQVTLDFKESHMGHVAIIELVPGRLRLRAFFNSSGFGQVSIDTLPISTWTALKKVATRRKVDDPEQWCRDEAAKIWAEWCGKMEGGR